MIKTHTGSYKPILKPPYKHCRWSPGIMPFQSEAAPSSLAMVATVPNIPLYLGMVNTSPATADFWSWSLTFAVSSGIVQIYISDFKQNQKTENSHNKNKKNLVKMIGDQKERPRRSKRRRRHWLKCRGRRCPIYRRLGQPFCLLRREDDQTELRRIG